MEKPYEAVTVAGDVEPSSSLSEPAFVSEKLPEQHRRPAERPFIDIGRTHHSGVADLLAGKLRSKGNILLQSRLELLVKTVHYILCDNVP